MKRPSNVLNTFSVIYPLYLLLLVFTPLIIGLAIDYELFDSRYIIINLIWIPLFTVPVFLLNIKHLYKAICTIVFLIGFLETGHWIILKGPVTITSLLVMSNTNLNETLEFFDLKATAGLFLLIPYTALYIFSLKKFPKYDKSKSNPFIIGFILMVGVLFIAENAIHHRFIRKGVPQFAKVVFSFFEKRDLYKQALQKSTLRTLKADTSFDNKKQLFVLILGESANRNHMSLYGYERKTSPKLAVRNDIIVYQDVVSAYSNTLSSVLSMLSESNLQHEMSFDKSTDVFDVFHSAGFKTYWISNQSPIGVWDNLVTVLANKADDVKFVNTSSNSSMEATLTTSYDEKLFKPFKKVLIQDVDNKFVVLHLMGSHSAYRKRYPADFRTFTGENKKEKLIAAYDNSILYTDYIVDSLFNIISAYSKKQNLLSTALYLSDHGENVFDEQGKVGHDFSKRLPRSNVEIPFLFWCSDSYKLAFRNKYNLVKQNAIKPFVADDLFYTILDIAGIKGDFFEANKSVVNKQYNKNRIRILEDGNDYDVHN